MIKNIIKKEYLNIFEYAKGNLFLVGLLGSLGFPLYYIIWQYFYPQPYENLTFRLICSVLFLPWVFYERLPQKLSKLFPHYFFLSLFVSVPLFFSFMLFANSFSDVWLMSFLTAIYLAVLLLYNWILIILMFGFSILINYGIFLFINYEIQYSNFDDKYIPIYLFALASGILCYRSEIKNQIIRKMHSIGGSVAHEMRNPLNAINLFSHNMQDILSKPNNKINNIDIKELIKNINYVSNCTSRANQMINIILSSLKGETSYNNFGFLSVNEHITQSTREYGYDNEEQRDKVILDLNDDFIIKAEKTAFIYIIFNLIKNALYYLNSYPNSLVTVYTQKGNLNEKYNKIIVKDTGPGISKNKLKSIFKSFYTSGKSDGTGLGLDFCKRTMESFNGKIECESELGKYTKFILSFPKVAKNEENLFQENISQKPLKFLLVDDQMVILNIVKKAIANHINGISIDIRLNGKEAIKALKESEYDFVLSDVEMPIKDGINAVKEIRKFNKYIPIIAYTSLINAKEKVLKAGMNDYVSKHQSTELLIRNICKWNLINYVPFIEKKKENYKYKVLLADDNLMNQRLLKQNLEKNDFEVEAVRNGQDLVNKYINRAKKGDNYDIIISDIHMPSMTGIEATTEILKYNKENQIKIHTPIIAYTGDQEKEKIHKILNARMTDYFIKGSDPKYLINLVNFWIYHKNEDY